MSERLSGQPTVIVLAAGKGERFVASGGGPDKLQALLAGRPVREHVLQAVRASGLPFHVVERQHTQHLPHPGMGDSIACGVAATPDAQSWLILPADLPLIQAHSLSLVAAALATQTVVVPCYQGQAGHPVGFGRVCQAALLALKGEQGARSVLAQFAVHKLVVEDPGCVRDIDTLESLVYIESIIFNSKILF